MHEDDYPTIVERDGIYDGYYVAPLNQQRKQMKSLRIFATLASAFSVLGVTVGFFTFCVKNWWIGTPLLLGCAYAVWRLLEWAAVQAQEVKP